MRYTADSMRMRAVLIAMIGLAMAAPAALGQAAADADDAMTELRQLLESAPSRQLGQPGNDVVDRLIEQQFTEAVARHNDPQRQAKAEARQAEAEKAQAKLTAATMAMYTGADQLQSHALVRYTVEQPAPATVGLFIVGVLIVVAWVVQKRKSLLAAACVAFGLAVAVIIAAVAVTTPVEQVNDAQRFGERIQDAEDTIPRLKTQLASDKKSLIDTKEKLAEGPTALNEKIKKLEQLPSDLDRAKKKLEAKPDDEKLTKSVEDLTRQLEGRPKTVEATHKEIRNWKLEQQNTIDRLTESIPRTEARIAQLERDLPVWKEQAARQAEEIQPHIEQLERQLADLQGKLAAVAEAQTDAAEALKAQNKEVERQLAYRRAEVDALAGGVVQTTEGLARARDRALRAALEAEARAAAALEGLWHRGRMHFPTAAFVPGKADLSLADGRSVRLYQLTPNLVEPANLPDDRFAGPMVYVGQARTADLASGDLRGAAALVDFDCGRRWLDCVQLGAEVIVVLEPPDGSIMLTMEASKKFSPSPISVPRFYLKRDDWKQLAADGKPATIAAGGQVTITQEPGRWRSVEAAIDWLLIPGTTKIKGGKTSFQEDVGRQLVHIQAYKDSASFVPELSPGATGASNLVLLRRLLAHFGEHPPIRPVLMSVVNDHANALRGEQEYAFAAFAEREVALDELDWLDKHAAQQRFIRDLYAQAPSDELIEQLRHETRKLGGQVIALSKPIKERLRSQRNQLRDVQSAVELELEELAGQRGLEGDPPTPEQVEQIEADVERLTGRRQDLRQQAGRFVELIKLFNRIGDTKRFGELTADELVHLKQIFADVSEQAGREAEHLQRARQRWLDNMAVRRRLVRLQHPAMTAQAAAESTTDKLVEDLYAPVSCIAAITLDLSFNSDRLGFFYEGYLNGKFGGSATEYNRNRVKRLARHMLKVAESEAQRTGEPNRLVDTMRYAKGLAWQAHMGGHLAMGGSLAHRYDMAGATLSVVRDMRPTAFTPHDTVDRINAEHFRTVMGYAESYLPALVNSEELGEVFDPQGDAESYTQCVEVTVHEQDKYSINPAEAPTQADALMVLYRGADRLPKTVAMLGEVRLWMIAMTDARGAVTIRSKNLGAATLQVFGYDADYRKVRSTLDLGDGEKSFETKALAEDRKYVRQKIISFSADKVDLIGLTEPLTLRPAVQIDVMEATQNSLPRHFGMAGMKPVSPAKSFPTAYDGAGCLFVEPGMDFKLRIGAGLAVNIDPTLEFDPDDERSNGVGFPSNVGILRNLALTSTEDLNRLAHKRLNVLADKGVVDDAAGAYSTAASDELTAMAEAQRQGRSDKVLVSAEEARGLAYRAYDRTLSTINDLIQAVVIFLALVIPFCFFLMKLTTPFTDVNRQLALFAAVFVVMAVVLRFVHPAFEIAATPQVVILAFVILGLAVFVASIMMGRFNASMSRVVEQTLQSESADAPQGRLAGVAFMVGVNNMKRRRIRTTLTTATIVLVTFTMLSVISVGRDVEAVRMRQSSEAPYNGFVFTAPGKNPIDAVRLRRLRAHFDTRAQTVPRVWVQQQDAFGAYLPYELLPAEAAPDARVESLEVKVLLGVETAEDGFLGPVPLAAGRWFSANDALEVILSVRMAGLLGIGPHNFKDRTLVMHGRDLKLVGLLDDEKLSALEDLARMSLLPMMVEPSQKAAVAKDEKADDQSRDVSSETEVPGSYIARPEDVAFVPIDFALTLGNASYRMLCAKYAPGDDGESASARAWADANHLTAFQHVRLNVAVTEPVQLESGRTIEPGQYALASSSTAEVGGVLRVAIPTILAATIIFNTMLGSVMERRREIGIYNAIGLNPTHVMMFFLAESMVFGLVGAVAGYLIGQILSVVITQLNIIELNLNYSSLSVLVVIFLTMGTVLLSTLYPAMMAARAAVPSGQRRWSAPQPDGDEVQVDFPFSYDAARVLGICAYLREFMRQNSEASTGKFLAGLGPVGWIPAPGTSGEAQAAEPDAPTGGARHDRVYVMIFDIAPAPFDLGVNQKMEVYAYYSPHVRAHLLSVHLRRLSGERTNWVTVNQPFLESLRKRLLSWRSQRPETQQLHYEAGEKLFANAPQLTVRSADADTTETQP